MNISTEERFYRFVDVQGEDDCWNWLGCKEKRGYGRFAMPDYIYYAHRMSYLIEHDFIPENKIVRHSCDNTSCVNPKHLLVGTDLDNARDRDTRGRNACSNKTHCPKGHPYDETNTKYRKTNGARVCRECGRISSKAYDKRIKELQNG